MIRARCHPDRKHQAHGMCASCNAAAWSAANPEKKKAHAATYRAAHIEQRKSISAAYSDNIENIVVSCALCNRRKGTMTDTEFLDVYARIVREAASLRRAQRVRI